MIKRFNDLTYNELIKLSDSEVEKLVEIELAYAGVPQVIKPTPPVQLPVPAPSVDVYYVHPIYSRNKAFVQKIIDVINDNLDQLCDTHYGRNSTKYVANLSDYTKSNLHTLSIEKSYVSSIDADEVGRTIAINDENEKKYKEQVVEYDTAYEIISEIKDKVKSKVWEAVKVQGKIAELNGHWLRFLSLAEGDADIAHKFFDNSYAGEYARLKSMAEKIGLCDTTTESVLMDQVFNIPEKEAQNG